MRLRFLGAPHTSKSSHLAVGSAARCKEEEQDESTEAKAAVGPLTVATDVTPLRQLRQRRVGVGMWAIRRQKMERAAQLRPRIVVHMSRLRGRKTASDFGAANLHKKRKLRRLASACHTVTTADVMSPETKNGTDVGADTGVDAADGFKPDEDGDKDDVDNSQMGDKENGGKSPEDAVNARPKRHIMHKKLVSVFASLNKNVADRVQS